MTVSWKISTVTDTGNQSLIIVFNDFWYQEDIESLQEMTLKKLSATGKVIKQLERTIGADREYSRFLWAGIEYSIHFECYSQSCWFEIEPQPQTADFVALTAALSV